MRLVLAHIGKTFAGIILYTVTPTASLAGMRLEEGDVEVCQTISNPIIASLYCNPAFLVNKYMYTL